MKKFFGIVLTMIVTMLCTLSLAACDGGIGGGFEPADIVSVREQLTNYISENLNKKDELSGRFFTLNNNYVCIGTTKGVSQVDTVQIGSTTFRKDSKISMSKIGSSTSYLAFKWNSDTGELEVSALALLLEGGTKIAVNKTSYNFALYTSAYDEIVGVSLDSSLSQSSNQVKKANGGHYYVYSSDLSGGYNVKARLYNEDAYAEKARAVVRVSAGDGSLIEYRAEEIDVSGYINLGVNFIAEFDSKAPVEGTKTFKILTINNLYQVMITSYDTSSDLTA